MQALTSDPLNHTEREQVRLALRAALDSPTFQNAQRAKGFLQFVVERAVAGERENLKERTIGIEVFGRAPNYSTGEDAVVRVQASDVRKRLDRFNQSLEAQDLAVSISLPSGAYCPQFRFREQRLGAIPEVATKQGEAEQVEDSPIPEPSPEATGTLGREKIRPWGKSLAALGFCAALFAGFLAGRWQRVPRAEDSPVGRFWAPLFVEGKPILLCIPRSASYRLTNEWFAKYDRLHPHEFDEEWERLNRWPDLDPSTVLKIGDLQRMLDHGVGAGDVYTATALVAGLTRSLHTFQVRVGQDYQFEDIRKNPSVLIGAFNNRWTMQLGSTLPFRFEQKGSRFAVVETGENGRAWVSEPLDSTGHWVDYALIARLPRSETGQPAIIMGGTGRAGTEIIGDFAMDNVAFGRVLSVLPAHWEDKNVILVLRTKATDGLAGPPEVIASRVW